MERSSNKHGPRIDDEMEKEVRSITKGAPAESRAEPGREMEGSGDDQPAVEQVLSRPGHTIPAKNDPRKEAMSHGAGDQSRSDRG